MNLVLGVLLVVVGGLMEGTYTVALMRTPKWKWEHTWGLGSLFALILIPWPVAFLTVPNLSQVYHQVSSGTIIVTALFGLGWGVGSIFFGLGVKFVGVALGISLIMGIIAAFGSAGPLLFQNPQMFLQPAGIILTLGLIIMILGVIVCALAGNRKVQDLSEKIGDSTESSVKTRKVFIAGLIICVLSGLLSPLLNYAFIFGADIQNAAVASGANQAFSVNAIWSIVYTVNYMLNFFYCVFLIIRNKNMNVFIENSQIKYWGWALFIGILWPLGITLYGIGASKLGDFGAYAGFPMMLVCSILGSNLVGALIGEWKGTKESTKRTMKIGVSILIIAAILFAYSNSQIAVQ